MEWVERRGASPKASATTTCLAWLKQTLTLALLPAMLLLPGCAFRPSFASLKSVDADTGAVELPAHRQSARFGVGAGGDTPPSYVLSPSDVIEFSYAGNAELQVLTGRDGGMPPPKCGVSPLGEGENLAAQGPRPRVGAQWLAPASLLWVRYGPGWTLINICVPPGPEVTWGSLRSAIEGADSSGKLKVVLIAAPPRNFYPGDQVEFFVDYQLSLHEGRGLKPFNFMKSEGEVDASGRLTVPGLADPSPASKPSSITQMLKQDGAAAAYKIRVHDVGKLPEEQLTLYQLEQCLAARWPVEKTEDVRFAKERARCLVLGVSAPPYPFGDADNQMVRYRIALKQTWTAILWDGRRVERPFRPGQSVAEASLSVFSEAFAHRLAADEDVYATIDPRAELRAAGERPFYARLDGKTKLASILMAPGDVLYLSRRQPRAISSD